ncbi:MAG: hypothetical protein OEX09_09915 [Candidatus Bathyarchaeota archaeon]|nr:hypothetical protein [Candidatus Bathyarchaeota archaeon]
MRLKGDILTLRFPVRKRLGWRGKPKKGEQWEDLVGETCIFEFLLDEPIIGIVDDYDEDVVYIYNAFDLTRGTRVNTGALGLNIEAIRKMHVLENWYVYEARRAVKRVQRDRLDKLPSEFTAWHARCILKLSPYVEEWPIAETICMSEDDIDMDLGDGTAFEKEGRAAKADVSITDSEASELVQAVRKIDELYEQRKIRGDYGHMLARAIIRIAELIGAIASRRRGADETLKGDRDLYEMAMMYNDFLRDSLEIYEEEENKN